ncbi:hypothetical protein HK097_003861, partial [Rhizophlyctis rosea]
VHKKRHLGLYKFYVDCGRMGDVKSLFLATRVEIKRLRTYEGCWNDVLGKHGDLEVDFNEKFDDVIERITEEPSVIDIFRRYKLEMGINPVESMKEDEKDKEYWKNK